MVVVFGESDWHFVVVFQHDWKYDHRVCKKLSHCTSDCFGCVDAWFWSTCHKTTWVWCHMLVLQFKKSAAVAATKN